MPYTKIFLSLSHLIIINSPNILAKCLLIAILCDTITPSMDRKGSEFPGISSKRISTLSISLIF